MLTISVGFQIDEEGNILDSSKIAKSIINPAFAFNLDELQRIVSAEVPFEEWKSWNCGCKMES
jgi:exoribonuclease R